MPGKIKIFCWMIFALMCFVTEVVVAEPDKSPYLISIYCPGGWDQSLIFENPTKQVGNITYQSNPNRPHVDQFFAEHHQNSAIINGVYFPTLDQQNSLFSELPTRFGSIDWSTYYTYQKGRGYLFPHLDFRTDVKSGSRPTYDFAKLRLNVPSALQVTRSSPQSSSDRNDSEKIKEAIERLQNRMSGNSEVNRNIGSKVAKQVLKERNRFTEFTSNVLPILTRYRTEGVFTFRDQILTTIDAFKEKISYATTLQYGSTYDWMSYDSSSEASSQLMDQLFADLTFLIEQLKIHSLERDVIIVVYSDSGKRPTKAQSTNLKRWPYTSVMLWGSLFASGVYGELDDFGRGALMMQSGSPTNSANSPHVLDFRNLLSTILFSQEFEGEPFLRRYPIFSSILR